MKRIKLYLARFAAVAFCAFAANAASSSPEGWSISRNSHFVGRIILQNAAGVCEEYAASELAKYIDAITGRKLPVSRGASAGPGDVVLRVKEAPIRDSYVLSAKNGVLEICGASPRGVLFGVYDFLERFGGVRWYASWMEKVPRKERIAAPANLHIAEKPAFDGRENLWFDYHRHPAFAVKMRCTAGAYSRMEERLGGDDWRFGGGLGNCHTMLHLVPPEQYAASHPEFFAMRDGKRIVPNGGNMQYYVQYCLSNPRLLALVTSNVLARIRQDPTARCYGVSQCDNQNYCQCETCAAIDREEGSPSGSVIRFANKIAEAVEREFPDKYIETLAYQYSRHCPAKTRPRHNVLVCLCSIECEFARSFEESSYQANRDFCRDLREWGAVTKNLYVWDYVTNFHRYYHLFANISTLRQNCRILRDANVRLLFPEGSYQGQHGAFAELKGWMLAKWMWNPEADRETLMQDFFEGYYGPSAAGLVREVYEEAERTTLTSGVPLLIFASPNSPEARQMMPTEFLEDAHCKLHKAEELARQDGTNYARNVRMTGFSVDAMLLDRLNCDRYDFTSIAIDPGEVRAKLERRQALAKSLCERFDEAGTMKLCEIGTDVIGGYRAILDEKMPETPAAHKAESGIVEEIEFRTWKNEQCDIVDDAAARNGKAVKITTYDWAATMPLDIIRFPGSREVTLWARMRFEGECAGDDLLSWIGVYNPKLARSVIAWTPKGREVTEPSKYAWYKIGSWKPDRDVEYVWLGNGKTPGSAVFLDALRFD